MDKDRQELARTLFAVAMSLEERGAALALSGQARRLSQSAMIRLARDLQTNAEAAALIAAAIERSLKAS